MIRKLSFKEITNHDIIKFQQKILAKTEICLNFPIEELGKLFFKEFQGDDIFENFTFQEIRNQYINDLDECEPIPEKEKDFFAYICCQYIGFHKEPRICLLKLYQNASEDLFEIEEKIIRYQASIKKIEEENSREKDNKENSRKKDNKKKSQKKDNKTSYEVQIWKHYLNLNIEAKNEIIKFISTEQIKSCALEKASGIEWLKPILNLYREEYTYSYRHQPSRYDADNLSHIANKFLYFNRSDMSKLEKLYKNNPLEFYEYTQKYIAENKIIQKIKQYCYDNHFLNLRLDLIELALDSYDTNKVLFINLIPLQIEGIFYDYCIGLGIPEESLEQATIGAKLEKIIAINPNLYDFEYFKFIFPQTRNRVAHGKLFTTEESNQISCLLLLDLYDVCGRITSEDIPVNLMVDILKKIKHGETSNENLLKLEYGYKKNLDIPDFYNLAEVKQLAKEKCNKNSFFQYLDDTITKSNNIYFIRTIEKIVNSLKKQNIQVSLCSELLRKINHPDNPKLGKFDFDFIKFCQLLS
ncbi:MAG: hypothetical protein NTY89_23195 [Nostocales cyanobacterium LacPavin_0920_SED1_MAG_38_18]|jgi:hypothetical protein|nr:hypothetical protein [Nostocales cyanobacterium LacPavin_0920_SED1_MAG_38_18]